ncbi:MAG: GTP-binding protein [Mariprofundaceae bacterium]|nr:GTP-binding protein [Mariprofundaceae bacterium]
MQIRTFSAPRLHQALSKVRKELGPDALILDREKGEDEEGQSIWQVRAALERASSDPGEKTKQTHRQPEPSKDSGIDPRLQASVQHLERLVSGLGQQESATLRQSLKNDSERHNFDSLMHCGVKATYAADLAPAMTEQKSASAACLNWANRLRPGDNRETILISGPAGAGKTTMIANLATYFSMQDIPVALISTDTERIGGLETLAAYASVLGINLHAMRHSSEAADLLQKTKSARLLLIDSEGWSQACRKAYLRQSPLWQALSPDRRMLLLPANMDEADGMALIDASADAGITDLLPSKLDETSRIGKVVNWAADSRLPLSYCSFGTTVPDKMGWLNPKTLATLLSRTNNKEVA